MLTHALRLLLGHQLKPFAFRKAHDSLPDLNVPNLGVYVHIPFCETLCPFCPYYKTKYEPEKVSPYRNALLREMELVVERAFPEKREVTSVYFGGGSPALMVEDLPEITERIGRYFRVKGNTGVELHPRDVRPDLPAALLDAGFDMVSLGVQSFSSRLLKRLGRTDEDPRTPLALLAGQGIQAIDVYQIFGIPAQTEEDLRRDFLVAAGPGATQISTYPFIDFSFAKNRTPPLQRKEKKRLLTTLLETADKAGFVRSSIWTFGRKNSPKYSSITRDNFLGFGPSATSLGRDCFKANTFSVDAYIDTVKKGTLPTALAMHFTARSESFGVGRDCYGQRRFAAQFAHCFVRH